MEPMLISLSKSVFWGMTLGAFFCWLAAKILKVPEATYVKAFLAMLPISILNYFFYEFVILIDLPFVVYWLLNAALDVVILKWIYRTVWVKAELVWLIGIFIPNLLLLLLIFLGLGALFSMA